MKTATQYSTTMDHYFTSNNYGDRYLQEVNNNTFNKLGAYTYLSEHFDSILLEKERLYIVVGTDSTQLAHYLLKKGVPAESEYLFIETEELYETIHDNLPAHPQFHLVQPHNWEQLCEEMDLSLHIQSRSAVLVRSIGANYGYHKAYASLFNQVNHTFQTKAAKISAHSNPFHFYRVGFTNMAENQHNVSVLRDQFEGKTAVLLGAAPSLDQHIEWIQQNQEYLYIFTVSRLANKLHRHGITPHFIVTVDPDFGSFKIGKEAFKFEQDSILIHSYHGNPQLVSQWSGKQLFTGYRYYWKTDLNSDSTEQTGSTVSNAALDAAIIMGFSQILLAGVDFCFDSKGYTHASGTGTATTEAPMVVADAVEKTVINNLGETVETTFEFGIAGEEFSKTVRAYKKPHQTVSNLSGSAMRMADVEYIEKEQIVFEPSDQITAIEFPEHSKREYFETCIGELKRINIDLTKINKLCNSIIEENNRLFDKHGSKNLKVEKRIVKQENTLNKRHEKLMSLIKRIGQAQIMKHLHATRKDQSLWVQDEVTASSIAYYQVAQEMVKTLKNSIKDATQRINSRIQELMPEPPSFSALIEQWEQDEQPRRAVLWRQSHPDAYQQLSLQQQQKIEEMENEFTASFEAEQADTIKHNTIEESLTNIINLANNNNQPRLEQLIPKLEEHPDKENAPYYIALCEALIAEFSDQDSDAFTTYGTLLSHQQQLPEEMIAFILERVSTTAIRLKDYNNALFALQTLCEVYNSDYHTPIYAELLYLLGNHEPAIEVFDKHLSKNPNDIKSMFRFADLQIKEKRFELAKDLLEKLLEKESGYLPAQQRLREIVTTPSPQG